MYYGGPYAQTPPRLPSGYCIKCRVLFKREDRYRPIFIVTAIENHFSGAGRAAYVSRFTEFGHHDCKKPDGNLFHFVKTRRQNFDVNHPDLLPEQEPRTPSYVCNMCRKEFKPGDRIVQVLLCAGTCIDPVGKHPEMVASPNFESAHENCNDPQLTMSGGLVINTGG